MSPSSCPCGSSLAYAQCCGRFHAGELPATPEQLMRSRYAAFALGELEYLRATWHPGTLPDDLSIDASTHWRGLTIVDAPAVAADARRGIVEFEARYVDGEGAGVLHERSRFVWQSDRWWYLDGVHG